VLVADGQGTVENTGRLVAAIGALTAVPIRYVIVGSEHGDHRGGDSAFPATATFIAHLSSKSALARQAAAPVRRANVPPVVVPNETVAQTRTRGPRWWTPGSGALPRPCPHRRRSRSGPAA
jgi:hypothetical protein